MPDIFTNSPIANDDDTAWPEKADKDTRKQRQNQPEKKDKVDAVIERDTAAIGTPD